MVTVDYIVEQARRQARKPYRLIAHAVLRWAGEPLPPTEWGRPRRAARPRGREVAECMANAESPMDGRRG